MLLLGVIFLFLDEQPQIFSFGPFLNTIHTVYRKLFYSNYLNEWFITCRKIRMKLADSDPLEVVSVAIIFPLLKIRFYAKSQKVEKTGRTVIQIHDHHFIN